MLRKYLQAMIQRRSARLESEAQPQLQQGRVMPHKEKKLRVQIPLIRSVALAERVRPVALLRLPPVLTRQKVGGSR